MSHVGAEVGAAIISRAISLFDVAARSFSALPNECLIHREPPPLRCQHAAPTPCRPSPYWGMHGTEFGNHHPPDRAAYGRHVKYSCCAIATGARPYISNTPPNGSPPPASTG